MVVADFEAMSQKCPVNPRKNINQDIWHLGFEAKSDFP
jgi:hypothetical protein